MNFFTCKEDNTHLQIAWNAATVGLNPTRIRKGLLKRDTIMLYDISKSCKLIDVSEREYLSLKTQAQLLCGITKIMGQKTSFLYQDTLDLCSRLQSAMAVSPARTDHIDVPRATSNSIFNYHAITMKDTDDLLLYQNSNIDVPFTDMFDFSHAGGPDFFEKKLYEQDFDSVLHLTNSLSIDIPYMESEYPHMLYAHSSDMMPNLNSATMYENKEMFDDFPLDYGDDMDVGDYGDDGVDFSEAFNYPPMEQDGVDAFPILNTNSEEIFDLPLNAEIISSGRSSSGSSPLTRSTTTNGHVRTYSNTRQSLPSLIAEEDEDNDTSISSMNTDMYSNIVETDEIIVSPIPPELPRPRIVRRMMLQREQDTVLPWSAYTTTDRITRTNTDQNTYQDKLKRKELIQKELRLPTIALDEDKNGELALFSDEKYRFYFSHHLSKERNTREIPRNQIELSRRDHRQYSSSGSNSGSAVHIRSSSDVTGSVDMHHMDLSDIDMRNAENGRFAEPSFSSNYADGQFYYDDDDIDYGHFDFDDGFQNALENSMISSTLQKEQDEENRSNQFLGELDLRKQQQNSVYLEDILQTKDRNEKAKSFYYLLELASNNKVRPNQNEPFGSIQIQIV